MATKPMFYKNKPYKIYMYRGDIYFQFQIVVKASTENPQGHVL